jgi:phosphopantothenoylcysteine synthetase/decarboxylase
MKAKLLTASSAIALAAVIGSQLPSMEIGPVNGSPFGISEAVAQTSLPLKDDENDLEPADIEDDEDDDDDDDDDEDDDDDDEDDDDDDDEDDD